MTNPTAAPIGDKSLRNCFIAAGVGADFSQIQRVIQRAGWRAILVTDLPTTAASLASTAHAAIAACDLTIGVLSGRESDQTVLFELGIATALGKPVIVVAEQRVKIPETLRGMPLVRLAPGADSTLELAIDRVQTRAAVSPAPVEHKAGGLGDAAAVFLSRVKDADTELALITVLAAALRQSGLPEGDLVEQGRTTDAGRFDLGVWSPELESSVGNPLLIEIKRTIASPALLTQATSQVRRYLDATASDWGMLVYADGPPSNSWEHHLVGTPILVLRADELISGLEDRTFPDFVRYLRNQRVHTSQVA